MSYAHRRGIHYPECEMNMGQINVSYPKTLNPYIFIHLCDLVILNTAGMLGFEPRPGSGILVAAVTFTSWLDGIATSTPL